MKKQSSLLLFILLLIIIGSCSSKLQSNDSDIDIHTLFRRWDEGKIENSEKVNVIGLLADYLSEKKQISSEDIKSISPYLSVYEVDNLILVEYIENPEFYGLSARESYHIAIYNGKSEIIESKGSMWITDVRNVNGDVVIYAIDYRVSTITGVRIIKLEIVGDTISVESLIRKESLIDRFYYDEISEVLYYQNGHLSFKEITDNGDQVLITVGDTDFLMIFNQNGYYQFTQ